LPSELRNRAVTQRARLDAVMRAQEAAINSRIEKAHQELGFNVAALDAMSPLKVLERGYAIAQNAVGKIVRDASAASVGDELRVRLWKGALDCRVEKTEP
jgi:exodeoxyribonuclease VII large subunit